MKRHRSVLSRLERVRILEEKGSLDLSQSTVLGLPKVKHLRIRIKKEKAAAAAPGTEAAAAAGGEAAPAAAPAKGSPKAAAPAGKSEASSPSKKKE